MHVHAHARDLCMLHSQNTLKSATALRKYMYGAVKLSGSVVVHALIESFLYAIMWKIFPA